MYSYVTLGSHNIMRSVSTKCDSIKPSLAMGIYAVISPHVQRDQELVSAVSRAQCQLEGTIEKLKKGAITLHRLIAKALKIGF